jgi:hypothetical protein
MTTILKPHHSESRTLWHVDSEGEIIATLEVGQVWISNLGAAYRLVSVDQPRSMVLVERCDRHYTDRYIWQVYSLVNVHNTLATLYWFNKPRNGIFCEKYRDINGLPVGDTVGWRYRAAMRLPPDTDARQLLASVTSDEIAEVLEEVAA